MESLLKIGNHKIKVTHPNGTELEVEGNRVKTRNRIEIQRELRKEGIPWGDAIKWVTDKLGIKQCPSCQQAQLVANQINKIGWVEALRQIRAIKGW